MRIRKLFLILALMMAPITVQWAHADDKFGELTPQQVQQKLKQKNVYVFDNNDPSDFKDAHVPSAKWLHPSEYAQKELPADKNATLIFYCHNEH